MKRTFVTLFFICFLPFSIKSTTTSATEQVIATVSSDQIIMQEIIAELNKPGLTSTQALLCLDRLLAWSTANKQNIEYVHEGIEIFHNSCKRFDFVNATVLSHILPTFTKECAHYTKKDMESLESWYDDTLFDTFTKEVRSTLILGFNTDFELFKKNPDNFINQLARQIAQYAQKEHDIAQLRTTIVNFLELTVGKLVWSPHDADKSWESVKKISTQLAGLVEANVIDSISNLDKLLWSLTHRFCFFIELTGSLLPDTFYATVANDLDSNKVLLVALEEQHAALKPKAAYIRDALVKGYNAAHASEMAKVV